MLVLQFASNPENEEILEEEAEKLEKDVDELNTHDIFGIVLALDEKAENF